MKGNAEGNTWWGPFLLRWHPVYCYQTSISNFFKSNSSLSHHLPRHPYCKCVPLWLSVKQYFTSIKPSQDICFWRVLICILNIPNAGHLVNFWYTYMNDFYFHCHDKDLWSSLLLQIVSMVKNEPHFFLLMFSFCIILQLFCAVLLLLQCKVLLLYYYRWVDCLTNKNADFIRKNR